MYSVCFHFRPKQGKGTEQRLELVCGELTPLAASRRAFSGLSLSLPCLSLSAEGHSGQRL